MSSELLPGDESGEQVRVGDLLEATPDALVIVDGEGRIRLANSQAEVVFGYRRAELQGRTIETLVPERFRSAHAAQRERFIASASTRPMGLGLELAAVHRDGREIPVEISLSPVQTPVGTWVVCDVRDVSERRRSADALARLAAIVESSDEAIVGLSSDGVITSFNAAAERLYDYARAEAVGAHAAILLPSPDSTAKLTEVLATVMAGERVARFDATHRSRRGHQFVASVTVSPVSDSSGVIVGASLLTRDVTEQMRTMNALAEAEERFRATFAQAPIGMALIDLAGRYRQVNEALAAISGYSGVELEGKPAEAIMHPDDVGALRDALAAAGRGKQTIAAAERRLIHASGHPVWVSVQLNIIRDRDHDPLLLLLQLQDITDRRRHESKLQNLADRDALTGLWNRRNFGQQLNAHAALARRYEPEGALLMIDLDNFKYVNDTVGHQAGDEVIARVGELLGQRTRETDVLARLGGDEFALLLPKADAAAAELVAGQLLQTLRNEMLAGEGLPRSITASIGIAMFERGFTGEDVLVNADLAMYDAKEAGRDQAAAFRTEHHQQARMKGRLNWMHRIQAALEHDDFTLLAQPIVQLGSRRATRYELLLRMRDHDGDLIPPGAFLYIAERLDMAQQIDRWVVRQAIELLAEHRDTPDPFAVEVNLSGRSIGDPHLLALIEEQLRRAAIAPELLTFEITETAAVEHIAKARSFAEHLAQLGCRFALDDFGAGFGSFYYLKHLPFDYLKIDGEFVRNACTNKADQLVIGAVVGIARGLGTRTIAEFVGDDETIDLLIRLGVDYGQGYHLGHPAPLGQLLAASPNLPHAGEAPADPDNNGADTPEGTT